MTKASDNGNKDACPFCQFNNRIGNRTSIYINDDLSHNNYLSFSFLFCFILFLFFFYFFSSALLSFFFFLLAFSSSLCFLSFFFFTFLLYLFISLRFSFSSFPPFCSVSLSNFPGVMPTFPPCLLAFFID